MCAAVLLRARRARGFTLIEVVAVLVVLGVLFGVGMATYRTAMFRAFDAAAETKLAQYARAGIGDAIAAGRGSFGAGGEDFIVAGAAASQLYEDTTFLDPDESSTELGEVSLAIGDDTTQEANVASGGGGLAALATRSKSGRCSYAVVSSTSEISTWTRPAELCAAQAALRPVGSGIDGGAMPGGGVEEPANPSPSSPAPTSPAPPTSSPTSEVPAPGVGGGAEAGGSSPAPTSSPSTGLDPRAPDPGNPRHWCGGRLATIVGTEGDDVLRGRGDDVIVGLAGDDTIYLSNQKDVACGGEGMDTIYGGNGKDVIYGDEDDDLLFGDNGSDLIFGGGGNDTIYGGRGQDTIYGGDGADDIDGGPGPNTIVQDGPNN